MKTDSSADFLGPMTLKSDCAIFPTNNNTDRDCSRLANNRGRIQELSVLIPN